VGAQLSANGGVSGLELLLPRNADIELTRSLVRAITRNCDLPLWVKLPLDRAVGLATVAVEAEAVGLVVGQPLSGAAGYQGVNAPTGTTVTGPLFGPLTFAPMLAGLLAVAKLNLPCALIGAGGIHTIRQARQALATGAHAIQIDSALWVEPGLPGLMVEATTS
jgi:dihydroorotate dehydrogenase